MTTQVKSKYSSLEEMYSSREYDAYISDRLGNDLFISDPDRAERIHEAAEHGTDGSTHAEVIEDWRDFLNSLKPIDPDFPEDGGEITEEDFDRIEAEIAACETWHEMNGSLNQIIG